MTTQLSHNFGGDWTTEKLDRIRKYLRAYTTIFTRNKQAQFYTTTYVDAFAGTGYRTQTSNMQSLGALFDESAATDAQVFLEGSASIALDIEPSFDQYLFIEQDRERAHELEELRRQFPAKAAKIRIENAEANGYLTNWCHNTDWGVNRALVFLDPYGMQVEWSLIEAIAGTQAIDLWILFPLGIAVSRLLTRSQPPPDEWANRLTRFFGTDQWINEFYPIQYVQTLFGDEEIQHRQADFDRIGDYFVRRLETIFPGVASNPLPLLNSKNIPLYLLCFAAGNPEKASIAINIAQAVLKR